MLACPKCKKGSHEVLDSRANAKHNAIRRKRKCKGCQAVFWTLEVHEASLASGSTLNRPKPLETPKTAPTRPKVKKKPYTPPPIPDFDEMSDDELENYIYGDNPPLPDDFY